MPLYQYEAASSASGRHAGVVAADSPRAARDQLRDRGLQVVHLAEQAPAGGSRLTLGGGRRVTRMFRELATLLAVGVRLADALELLANQAEAAFRPCLLGLRDRVVQGGSLSQAMGDNPKLFDTVACRVVAVGEQGGSLAEILEHLADYREKSERLKGKLTQALAYPTLVFVVGTGVCVFLMTRVVPTLLGTLQEMGRDLPPITRVVKAVSDGLVSGWWILLLAGLALGVGGWLAFQNLAVRRHWDRLLLRLPVIGRIHQNQQVARVAFVIGALMQAGVPFEETLGVARGTLSNQQLADGLAKCEEAVRRGRDLGSALRGAEGWPEAAVQAFALGQQSGQLPQILARIARDLDAEAERQAARLAGILEPLLILLLAVMVGTVALAALLPILEAGQGVG